MYIGTEFFWDIYIYTHTYLLTAIGLTPDGSSTVHTHINSTQNNTINLGRVWAVPRVCELYHGIYLTTEEKARENLSQGSRRVPVGTTKTEYTEENITYAGQIGDCLQTFRDHLSVPSTRIKKSNPSWIYSSCLHRASMIIKHLIIQLIYNI